MKILFINFSLNSTPGINHGIATLSAVLKQNGHNTKLLFINKELGYPFDLDRMEKDIRLYNPDMIAISLVETQYRYMVEFLPSLRKYFHGFVVCGGPAATMDPELILSNPEVDCVCVGEGEGAMVELAHALSGGLSNIYDLIDIPNLGFHNDRGINRSRPFQPLTTLPPEDLELFDLDAILKLKNYQLEILLGRGCTFRCSYCINGSYLDKYRSMSDAPDAYKGYVRTRDFKTVIKEIKDAIAKHPSIKEIAFVDDNFVAHGNREFCEMYKDQVGLPYTCNINPVSFSNYHGNILRESGCTTVRFGVESGSDQLKKEVLGRPISNSAVIKAFDIAKQSGLNTSSYNMIGIPTETSANVVDTLILNARLKPDYVKVMTYYPFKDTPLYDMCVRMNLIDNDKKAVLDNYDTYTCLKFTPDHDLFLRKVQVVFNWWLNMYLNNQCSHFYVLLLERVMKKSRKEWEHYDFDLVDGMMSDICKTKGIEHYYKDFNRSMAVLYKGEQKGD